MKKAFKIFLLAILVSMGVANSNEAKSQTAHVSFSVFYSSLKPYGRWVNHPKYGQIWISNTRGFVPYSTGGHWAYTDYGWTWVSDYDWGWAPFHYGRWTHDESYGWYWAPGYEWAPAWVAWRGGGDYYGWAPLAPGLSVSVNINTIPSNYWVFAPHRYITSPAISRYYAPRANNVTIIKNTTVVNNVTVRNNVNYAAGPRREDVERVNHTTVKTYTVSTSSKPGKTVVNNNTINVYRPVVNNKKTVVNNNNTTVNKNSNNTTVSKNSNNTTVNKKATKTTVNNKQTTVKNNNNTTVNKQAINEAVNKRQPVNEQSANHQVKNQPKPKNHEAQKPQQKQQTNDVAKRKNHNNNDSNKRK